MAKIKYIGYLAELAERREEEVKVDGRIKVKDLLERRIKKGLEELVILVNGLPGSLDTLVDDDDVISVLPVISGG
ncbi:MAG: MoaD/ThiS family protein [Thermoprotei archaeon]|nr:MAG: MoaD/ThiS family protein [Thermoprotei archaeon]